MVSRYSKRSMQNGWHGYGRDAEHPGRALNPVWLPYRLLRRGLRTPLTQSNVGAFSSFHFGSNPLSTIQSYLQLNNIHFVSTTVIGDR